MVEFNRGSWMAVKQKHVFTSLVCNGEIQNDLKMTTVTDYRYMSINNNGDVIGISFIKSVYVGFDWLNSQCVVVV